MVFLIQSQKKVTNLFIFFIFLEVSYERYS